VVGSDAGNRLDIFARGADNSLQHIWWNNAWGPWESLGGDLTSNPSVISWGPNRLDIFARGNDQGIAHIAWTGTNWGAWDALGGELTSDPAVVAWAPDRLDMFARGADATLQHDYWTGSAWGTWETHDAQISCAGDPAGIIDFCPPPPPTSGGGTGGTTASGGAGNAAGTGWSGTGGALSPKPDPKRAQSSDQSSGCNLSATPGPAGYLIVFLAGASALVVRRRRR
jgi:MYXO-CTERM domain-containing protein